jgi:hypothetical protein
MELQEYLDSKGIKHRHFSKQLGISLSTLHCILTKKNLPNIKLALEIEILTDGNVNLYDWFPDYNKKRKTHSQKPKTELNMFDKK